MGPNTTVQYFVERLNKLNRYLLVSLRNVLPLLLKMKSLTFLIRPNIQIGMKQWFQPTLISSKWITNRKFRTSFVWRI
jgi:hypothetical protein